MTRAWHLDKDILSGSCLYGVGLGSLTALVYLAGPLIAIGGFRPLENYIVREIAILAADRGRWRRSAASSSIAARRTAKALAEGMSEEDKKSSDEVVLKDKMKDALATLKAASGGKKDYLYDLPWYVLIGPPGSGKTTALVNSGLKFPLSRGATPAAIAGVGGTRYCDWWFTEDAVLIDTAGRYTTQDSDAKADKQSWFAFLDLLKKNRPRQPINGVMVAISLEDLMTLSTAELAAHAERDPRAPARTARPAEGRFPGLCAVHQGRSGRRLHRIFRLSRRERPQAGLGRDLPDRRQDPQSRRRGSGRVRRAARAPERGTARPAAGRAGAEHARAAVRLSRRRWRG